MCLILNVYCNQFTRENKHEDRLAKEKPRNRNKNGSERNGTKQPNGAKNEKHEKKKQEKKKKYKDVDTNKQIFHLAIEIEKHSVRLAFAAGVHS